MEADALVSPPTSGAILLLFKSFFFSLKTGVFEVFFSLSWRLIRLFDFFKFIFPGVLGETVVDEEKSKAIGTVLNNGRAKKRPTKLAKMSAKPWARLISQYSQVRFFVFLIYGLFVRMCKDYKQD